MIKILLIAIILFESMSLVYLSKESENSCENEAKVVFFANYSCDQLEGMESINCSDFKTRMLDEQLENCSHWENRKWL